MNIIMMSVVMNDGSGGVEKVNNGGGITWPGGEQYSHLVPFELSYLSYSV